MTHSLGSKSLGFMVGLHPVAIETIELAITLSPVDFGVTERQVRDLHYQRTLVSRGVSQTLKSNHLEQVDLSGRTKTVYGHACDLVPWIGGRFVWDWNALYSVAVAMAEAGRRLGVLDKMCWGGVWDQWMSEYAGTTATTAMMRQAEAGYCVRHPGKDFVDGPHFQWFKKG